jgi:hypothetical protein
MVAAMGATATLLFESDAVLDVELAGPLSSLLDDEKNISRDFVLTTSGAEHAVRVRMGGKSRLRVCSFPPLLLQFEREPAVAGDPFSGHDYLRMVTHCRSSRNATANVVEEYLAYRILNLLTDFSYRVRLLRVDYVDPEHPGKPISAYAFVSEPALNLAHRVGGELLAVDGLPKQRLNEEHAALVYVFQYLIGNTDWSLVRGEGDEHCCHNGQLITRGDEIFYIPYDFDITGLVNPHYAKPDPSLRITRVTRRLYRGYCGPQAALHRALAQVTNRRDAIMELYREAPAMTAAERDKGISFLESFFRRAEDPEKLLEQFGRQCLG